MPPPSIARLTALMHTTQRIRIDIPAYAFFISLYRTTMTVRHKNKTLATFLATLLGGLGVHRFFLHGSKDIGGWMHFLSVPLSLILLIWLPDQPIEFTAMPLAISAMAGVIEALAIGLTADEKWDATHNPGTGHQSASGWPLALLLVLTFGVGAIGAIATIARTSDLIFTGGAYG